MDKKVEITLDKDGGIKVEAFGFVGSSCEEATKFLEELYGEALEKELKEEYWQDETLGAHLPSGYCG